MDIETETSAVAVHMSGQGDDRVRSSTQEAAIIDVYVAGTRDVSPAFAPTISAFTRPLKPTRSDRSRRGVHG